MCLVRAGHARSVCASACAYDDDPGSVITPDARRGTSGSCREINELELYTLRHCFPAGRLLWAGGAWGVGCGGGPARAL